MSSGNEIGEPTLASYFNDDIKENIILIHNHSEEKCIYEIGISIIFYQIMEQLKKRYNKKNEKYKIKIELSGIITFRDKLYELESSLFENFTLFKNSKLFESNKGNYKLTFLYKNIPDIMSLLINNINTNYNDCGGYLDDDDKRKIEKYVNMEDAGETNNPQQEQEVVDAAQKREEQEAAAAGAVEREEREERSGADAAARLEEQDTAARLAEERRSGTEGAGSSWSERAGSRSRIGERRRQRRQQIFSGCIVEIRRDGNSRRRRGWRRSRSGSSWSGSGWSWRRRHSGSWRWRRRQQIFSGCIVEVRRGRKRRRSKRRKR